MLSNNPNAAGAWTGTKPGACNAQCRRGLTLDIMQRSLWKWTESYKTQPFNGVHMVLIQSHGDRLSHLSIPVYTVKKDYSYTETNAMFCSWRLYCIFVLILMQFQWAVIMKLAKYIDFFLKKEKEARNFVFVNYRKDFFQADVIWICILWILTLYEYV